MGGLSWSDLPKVLAFNLVSPGLGTAHGMNRALDGGLGRAVEYGALSNALTAGGLPFSRLFGAGIEQFCGFDAGQFCALDRYLQGYQQGFGAGLQAGQSLLPFMLFARLAWGG